mmetsp:Transcript_102517/g.187336  ORF Transcript_102517/g.187336 Transcript_102517/m.187336 type:complete len:249 (+) Transcript_102517:45-791(+)
MSVQAGSSSNQHGEWSTPSPISSGDEWLYRMRAEGTQLGASAMDGEAAANTSSDDLDITSLPVCYELPPRFYASSQPPTLRRRFRQIPRRFVPDRRSSEDLWSNSNSPEDLWSNLGSPEDQTVEPAQTGGLELEPTQPGGLVDHSGFQGSSNQNAESGATENEPFSMMFSLNHSVDANQSAQSQSFTMMPSLNRSDDANQSAQSDEAESQYFRVMPTLDTAENADQNAQSDKTTRWFSCGGCWCFFLC